MTASEVDVMTRFINEYVTMPQMMATTTVGLVSSCLRVRTVGNGF